MVSSILQFIAQTLKINCLQKHVLNRDDVLKSRYITAGGSTGARYDFSSKKLPGTNKDAWWVCNGNYGPIYMSLTNDVVNRISGFINHIISVLNS